MFRNTPQTYGAFNITLHWLTALGVLLLFPLGLWMVELDYAHRWYHRAPDLHKDLGMLLIPVVLARLAWRLLNPPPQPLGSALERALARLTQRLLYLLLVALLISGYLIPTAEGQPIVLFGAFEIPATLQGLAQQADIAGTFHAVLAWALMALVGVHVGAALKHQLIDRDPTLRRMLGLRPPAAN